MKKFEKSSAVEHPQAATCKSSYMLTLRQLPADWSQVIFYHLLNQSDRMLEK